MRISPALAYFLCLCAQCAVALSWGTDLLRGKAPIRSANIDNDSLSPASTIPDIHAMALAELQELESEPLCHRNAARLLITNCKLLENSADKDTTTQKDRMGRDFIDSYAASLALCDLERGSFSISPRCMPFREPALLKVPVPQQPHLHVSTQEIDDCLHDLAQHDSTWATWVSYRHKTSRFCEVARAENEKDENIRVYQRVTKILAKLTTDIEQHMEDRLRYFDEAVHKTRSTLEDMDLRVNFIQTGLGEIEEQMGRHRSHEVIVQGYDEAHALQQLLARMAHAAARHNEEITLSHESALGFIKSQAETETEMIITTLASAIASSNSIHNGLEAIRLQTMEVIERQNQIGIAMDHLQTYAEGISKATAAHEEKLEHVQRTATEIAGTLDSAASSAALFHESLTSSVLKSG